MGLRVQTSGGVGGVQELVGRVRVAAPVPLPSGTYVYLTVLYVYLTVLHVCISNLYVYLT